ncbi:hypothetical protein M9458_010449, partial [Cirrhinus mrigala]
MDIFKEDLIEWFGEVITNCPVSPDSPVSPLSPDSPVSPKLPVTLKLPPSLLLPPPLMSTSSSALPSTHPQSVPSGRSDPPCDFQSSAPPRHEDPLSLPLASESRTPPQNFDPSAPSWFLFPSGSTLVSCRPSADLETPLLRLHLVPLALSGSSFPPALPSSSVTPAPLQFSGSSPEP